MEINICKVDKEQLIKQQQEVDFYYNICITPLRCFEIKHDEHVLYIPFWKRGHSLYLGSWLVSISCEQIQTICFYAFKYMSVWRIYIKNVLAGFTTIPNEITDLHQNNHWKVDFDNESYDDLLKRNSAKSRYNLRRSKRLLEKDQGEVSFFKHDVNDITQKDLADLFSLFCLWKKRTHKRNYYLTPEEYISRQHVTCVYYAIAGTEIVSVIFTNETDGYVYLENISYSPEMYQYSPGIQLFDYMIFELSRQGKRGIYMGDGNQIYKKRYNAIEDVVLTGNIYKNKLSKNFYIVQNKVISATKIFRLTKFYIKPKVPSFYTKGYVGTGTCISS